MKNKPSWAVFLAILILITIALSGCISIPIPSRIPLPNDIPIIGWFL